MKTIYRGEVTINKRDVVYLRRYSTHLRLTCAIKTELILL